MVLERDRYWHWLLWKTINSVFNPYIVRWSIKVPDKMLSILQWSLQPIYIYAQLKPGLVSIATDLNNILWQVADVCSTNLKMSPSVRFCLCTRLGTCVAQRMIQVPLSINFWMFIRKYDKTSLQHCYILSTDKRLMIWPYERITASTSTTSIQRCLQVFILPSYHQWLESAPYLCYRHPDPPGMDRQPAFASLPSSHPHSY